MKKIFKFLTLGLSVVLLAGCSAETEHEKENEQPKDVIFTPLSSDEKATILNELNSTKNYTCTGNVDIDLETDEGGIHRYFVADANLTVETDDKSSNIFFELKDKDGFDINDYLAVYGVTREQLEQKVASNEEYSLDIEKNAIFVNETYEEKEWVRFEEESNQYYRISDFEDELEKFYYLDDKESPVVKLISDFSSVVTAVLEEGIFLESNNSYLLELNEPQKNDIFYYYFGPYYSNFISYQLFIKDKKIEKISANIEIPSEYTVIESKATIYLTNLGLTTVSDLPAEYRICRHNKGKSFKKYDDYFYEYCSHCKKILSEKRPYEFDDKYGVCKITGKIKENCNKIKSDDFYFYLFEDFNSDFLSYSIGNKIYLYSCEKDSNNIIYNMSLFYNEPLDPSALIRIGFLPRRYNTESKLIYSLDEYDEYIITCERLERITLSETVSIDKNIYIFYKIVDKTISFPNSLNLRDNELNMYLSTASQEMFEILSFDIRVTQD